MGNLYTFSPLTFQKRVLAWFDQHGRKTLPWQQKKSPYRVWVSEIMLQQTQVSTVIPYFKRFMDRFPELSALALAEPDEVLHQWTGLGYYTRARNLHKTAKIILESFAGEFPADLAELQSLPGIGRSTAGAIRAIAFEKRAAILDGNVKRVLTRLHGITAWPGDKKVVEQLWELTEKYTPSQRVADYTQAMMDLGATLCVRGKPRCEACPFQSDCVAFKQDLTKVIPGKKPKAALPVKQVTLLVLQKKDNSILLMKRPSKGIWGGLWSLPELPGVASEKAVLAACLSEFRYTPAAMRFGEVFRHTFSHYHLDILPAYVSLKSSRAKVMEADEQIWYNLNQPAVVGLPAPIKNLLMALST